MGFFGVLVLVLLVVALNDANKRADAAENAAAQQRQQFTHQPQPEPVMAYQTSQVSQSHQTHDIVLNAFNMDSYMKENNVKAFFCSHENRIYWVKNAEETLFCPNDSTLLYAC